MTATFLIAEDGVKQRQESVQNKDQTIIYRQGKYFINENCNEDDTDTNNTTGLRVFQSEET